MKPSLLFIYLFTTLASYGQPVKIETIKQVNPITKEIYVFPKIIISKSLMATQKVNGKLRETVLGILEQTSDANIFDSVWRTSGRQENISNLSFKVKELSSSILSLSISGEGCGAYCEAFDYYFTFNTKTGNQLTLDSLFTNKGLIAILKTLNDNKQTKLNTELKQIKHSLSLASVKKDAAEKERFSEMLSMYTECLTKKIEVQYTTYIQFLIENGTLIIYTDRRSAHYNRAYDELWTFVNRIVLKNSKKLLTQYGVSLVSK
jgi:hypothetical protein